MSDGVLLDPITIRYPTHEEALARVAELEAQPSRKDFIHREIAALRRIKDLEAEVRRLRAKLLETV